MENIIIVAILAVILGGAGRYIYKEKKSGARCIGCSACKGGADCHCHCSAK